MFPNDIWALSDRLFNYGLAYSGWFNAMETIEALFEI